MGGEGGKLRLNSLAGSSSWWWLSVALPQFPKWLEARVSLRRGAGPLSPGGPTSALV